MKKVALETQGSEAQGLDVFLHETREVGQEVAEFLPSLAARQDGLITGEEQAEVVAESAIDGLLETQLQNFGGGFSLRLAAGEWTLRSGERDGRYRRGILRQNPRDAPQRYEREGNKFDGMKQEAGHFRFGKGSSIKEVLGTTHIVLLLIRLRHPAMQKPGGLRFERGRWQKATEHGVSAR
jgi:hypothetical protein